MNPQGDNEIKIDNIPGSYIWSPQRPHLFFMHIPKTAGMALRLFLDNQYAVSDIFQATDWIDLLAYDLSELNKYRLFRGHFTCRMLDLLPPEVRPIVFLREPIARTISHLKHLRRDPEFHPAHNLAAGRSLNELVRNERIMGLCSNVQTGQLSNGVAVKTILAGLQRQWDRGRRNPKADPYVNEPDLAAAERNLTRFHFIGFVDSLQQDVLQMSLAFGLHPPPTVPKHNDDPDGTTDFAELDPESLAILRERNALDIALYERAKKLPRIGWNTARAALFGRGLYPPISRPTNFLMSGPIPGSNWYWCEGPADEAYRWTGPLNETTLDLPLAPGYRFEVSLCIEIPAVADLSVVIEGRQAQISNEPLGENCYRVSFWIPAEVVPAADLTSICFRTKEVHKGSGGDMRVLSFLVRELRIATVERDVPLRSNVAGARRKSRGSAATAVIAELPAEPIGPAIDGILPQRLKPGRILADVDLEELVQGYLQRRRDREMAEERFADELRQLRNYLGEVLASTRAPLAGYARQIGNGSGLFHDLWAGRELSLRLAADQPITGVTVKGVIPPELPDLSRTFDIEIDGELFAFWLHEKGSFVLRCSTLIAAGTVFDLIVRCDSEVNAGAIGAIGDRRNLAYRLTQIELEHASGNRRRGRAG